MSRQNVHGLYTRAKLKEKARIDDYSSKIIHIVNLSARGYSATEVEKKTLSLGCDVSYIKVREILMNEEEFKNQVKKDLRSIAVKSIQNEEKFENIKMKLSYKDVPPTKYEMTDILTDAYAMLVKLSAINEVTKVYFKLKDKSLVKKIISKTGLEITFDEINERAKIIFYNAM